MNGLRSGYCRICRHEFRPSLAVSKLSDEPCEDGAATFSKRACVRRRRDAPRIDRLLIR